MTKGKTMRVWQQRLIAQNFIYAQHIETFFGEKMLAGTLEVVTWIQRNQNNCYTLFVDHLWKAMHGLRDLCVNSGTECHCSWVFSVCSRVV